MLIKETEMENNMGYVVIIFTIGGISIGGEGTSLFLRGLRLCPFGEGLLLTKTNQLTFVSFTFVVGVGRH